jgi:hypothetical protein
MPCSTEKMELFLDRVLAYPQFVFTIVNTEQLNNNATELLMSFLSDRDVSVKGVNFHVVQRGDLIHASPWVSGRSWEMEKKDSAFDGRSSWLSRIVDGGVIDKLDVVSSEASGTGKTRMIRREMLRFQKTDAACQAASITIHEQSTVEQLVEKLRSCFKGKQGTRVLHISFSFLPQNKDFELYRRWINDMNHFLFSMLVLRVVSGENFASTFSLAATKWCIYIELPSLDEPLCSLKQWLWTHIPVIAACARHRKPSTEFGIDVEARRVSTYLRAMKDGTINRKFDEGANKRIMLVIDCSGSMSGTPFQTAVRNAAAIFDSHVVDFDVRPCNLFRGFSSPDNVFAGVWRCSI